MTAIRPNPFIKGQIFYNHLIFFRLLPPRSFRPFQHAKSAKTVVIDCVRFNNDEGHPDNMEIRDAEEGKEHRFTEDGEEICCPVCGTSWLQKVAGDFTFDSCKHLRFSLAFDCGDDFELFGEWDDDGFLKFVEKARAKDEDADFLDILNGIQHPDVEKAMMYVWHDDPLSDPWMIWGYQ